MLEHYVHHPPACQQARENVNIYNCPLTYVPIFSTGACRKSKDLAKSGKLYTQPVQPLTPQHPLSLLSKITNRKLARQAAPLGDLSFLHRLFISCTSRKSQVTLITGNERLFLKVRICRNPQEETQYAHSVSSLPYHQRNVIYVCAL